MRFLKLSFILVLPLLIGQIFVLLTSKASFAFQVVIDPGHGGPDLGTQYQNGETSLFEKDVTLKLAQQVAYQLLARGIRVTLTRNADQEISLPARTALANRIKADAFISIHMNSTHDSSANDAEGIETFILNNATEASSRRLAHLENSVITDNLVHASEQMDVALILKDLTLDANLTESKRLACHVQRSLVEATSPSLLKTRRNRGVKQALFHVLLGADMPSILVEAGFLSSARDRAFIQSVRGQALISRSIANAIDRFRTGKRGPKEVAALSRCKVN